VLSQLTATVGGSQTLTRSDTEGYGEGTTSSRSWQEFHLGFGNRSRGTSTSRNWSTGRSWADGTSWSDATSTQRVYEYAVEPAVLQNLPDHALLLATRGPAGPQLQAVECDLAIATLPGVSARPPAPLPRPARRGVAELASAGPPGWPGPPVRHPERAYLPRTRPSVAPRRPPGRHRA